MSKVAKGLKKLASPIMKVWKKLAKSKIFWLVVAVVVIYVTYGTGTAAVAPVEGGAVAAETAIAAETSVAMTAGEQALVNAATAEATAATAADAAALAAAESTTTTAITTAAPAVTAETVAPVVAAETAASDAALATLLEQEAATTLAQQAAIQNQSTSVLSQLSNGLSGLGEWIGANPGPAFMGASSIANFAGAAATNASQEKMVKEEQERVERNMNQEGLGPTYTIDKDFRSTGQEATEGTQVASSAPTSPAESVSTNVESTLNRRSTDTNNPLNRRKSGSRIGDRMSRGVV